jgi:hypothetical protein
MSAASVLTIAIGVVLGLPLVARALRRQFDPFEPIVIFALAYGVMFVARPAWMLAHGQLSIFGVDIRATLPRAMLLALVGAVAFVCCYEWRAGRALARALPKPREITTRAGVVGSMIFISLSLIALVVMLWPAGGYRRFTILLEGQTDEVGQLIWAKGSYLFMTALLVIPAAIVLLGIAIRDRRRGVIIGAALTCLFALLLMVPLGARTFLLPLVGGGLTLAYISRDKRPRLVTVVGLIVLAVVGSYALAVLREPGVREHFVPMMRHVLERPDTPVQFLLEGEDAEMAAVLAGALNVVPSRLHYRYGRATFGDLALRPIPREVWADKPKTSERQVVEATWPGFAKFGFHPAFSPLLVFYWDFGIAGVFAGMALLGIFCRTLYEWFLRHRGNLAAQMIFAVGLWLVAAAARYSPVDTIVFATFLVLPLILLERFCALRRPIIRPLFARARLSQR